MIGTDINQAITLLTQGSLVAIPTETVYGLAANALNVEAVAKIFAAKNRPNFNPLIVHTHSIAAMRAFCTEFSPTAHKLATAFMPGALTLVLPKSDLIPNLVTSHSTSVALRIPAHPVALSLLKKLPFPLAAPSANPFGYISPTTAKHVWAQLGSKIPYILDGGNCTVGIESTILKIIDNEAFILRLGGTSQEAIEQILGKKITTLHTQNQSAPEASGMLHSHYAPKKKLILTNLKQAVPNYKNQKIGVLSLNSFFDGVPHANQIQLAPNGDLNTAATNLFAALRHLDEMDITLILAEEMPNIGLGNAINDRLKRAAF